MVRISPRDALAELRPGAAANVRPAIDATEYSQTARFIESLGEIHSREVEAEIFAAFQAHSESHAAVWSNDDWIAESCVKILAHRGHDKELLGFCGRRRAEVQDPRLRDQIDSLILLLEPPPKPAAT